MYLGLASDLQGLPTKDTEVVPLTQFLVHISRLLRLSLSLASISQQSGTFYRVFFYRNIVN
jgi:hypothetical protein